MKRFRHFLLLTFVALDMAAAAEPVSWNFEVRPLLAAKCFSCHGTDAGARKAKLRLDDLTGIKPGLISPGHPEESELIKRLHSSDPDEIMPPAKKSEPLSPAESALLERWIAEGARTEKHWAFTPPRPPELPELKRGETMQSQSPIDFLVGRTLAAKNLHPAPPATRLDWMRRTSFALTGLPLTPEDIREAAVSYPTSAAAAAADEAFVDRLLASPHFGERLAQDWLDASRYGDTYGRHEDADSEMWPWRDWVIRSFNNNLPYDQFILWQTAGDLLPEPTQDQKIATAFNRLSVMSNESGSDPLEFRWAQVFDRVKTNATVFMGLTLECAQCHDHKYDPFSQKEFYQFASFFDNIDELGLFSRFSNGTPSPTTFVYKPGEEEEHRRLKQQIIAAEKDFESARAGAPQRFAEWLRTHAPPGQGTGLWTAILTNPAARPAAAPRTPSGYFSFDLIDAKEKKFMPDLGGGPGSSDNASQTPPEGKFGFGAGLPADKDKKYEFPGVAAFGRTDAFSFTFWLKMEAPLPRAVVLHRSRAGLDAANRGYELTLENGHPTATLAHFYPGNAIRIETVEAVDFKDWHHVGWTYDGSSKAAGLSLFIDGKAVATRMVRDSLTRDISYLKEWGDLDNIKVADAKGSDLITLQFGGRNLDKSLRGSTVDELKFYDCALTEPEMARSAGRREPVDEAAWLPWFVREIDAPSRAAAAALHEARVQENTLATKLRDLMVMQEQPGPRRATTVLARGRFDSPGDPVSPGTPAALSAWPAGATGDRLGLARWLTSPEHPLTSRVEVNRLWRLFFGRGLVATGHDFGIQGAPPTHPALLDWLAVHFQESGWNIKSLCREIVLSSTFRQSSTPSDAATLTADPDNRWLARGPRLRLPGEQIRDAALSVSGLLVAEIGGPSVKPWQPDGLWEDSGTQHTYEMDQGPALHRRSLYTFWRRTCPPPMLSAFDAPSREFCLVQREESLTPLQTLAVLNDRAFLEAARALAAKTLESPASDPAARVTSCFQRATGTLPSPPQLAALTKLHNESFAYYQTHSADAAAFLQSSGSPAAEGPGVPDQAALMVVCRALFSSGEFLETW